MASYATDCVSAVARIAEQYRADRYMPEPATDYATVTALPWEKLKPMVTAYIAADPLALPFDAVASYDELVAELDAQWHALYLAGYRYDVVDHDPYVTASGAPNSKAMRRDVRDNRHISVLSTAVTGSHPFLTDAENDLFRAVHDIFGHAATGRAFDQDGEEAAYQHHRSMFSNRAIPALTTETRVQNALNNLNDNAFIAQRAVIIDGAWRD